MSEFVDIKDFPGYKINIKGEIVNSKGLFLKYQLNVDGYPVVYLSVNGKKYCKRVHRLLAIEFIPNPDNFPAINHIDGDRTNYNIQNLEWTTPKANTYHSMNVLGERYKHNTNLSDKNVVDICKSLQSGMQVSDVAKLHKVSCSVVVKIKSRKSWSDISEDFIVDVRTTRLEKSIILKICEFLNQGYRVIEVVREMNHPEVSRYVVGKISNFKVYKEITKDILKIKEERSSTMPRGSRAKLPEMVGPR